MLTNSVAINALSFLLDTIFGLLVLAFLVRFFLQLTRSSFQNQLAQTVIMVTNFAVKPMRRLLPSIRNIDVSTLLLAYMSEWLLQLGLLSLRDFPVLLAGNQLWISLTGLALIGIIKTSIYIFIGAVLIQAVISWVSPYSAVSPMLNTFTAPVLKPFRKLFTLANGLYFSPLVFTIAAQLIIISIVLPLEAYFSASLFLYADLIQHHSLYKNMA